MKFRTDHWLADGGDVYLPIGFIPDYFEMIEDTADTQIIFYHWWRAMELDMGTGKQEGISVTEGVTANLADDAGIVAYDSGSEGPTISEYSVARSTAATARTATAPGTFLKPSSTGTTVDGLDADRSLVFECITAGTGSAEPNWNPTIGGTTTDGTTVFETVNQPTYRSGYQGVKIDDGLMTDGDEHFYNAWQADQATDLEDVDGWPSGVQNG